jgi:GNAT superfamily N-acetyltransferase
MSPDEILTQRLNDMANRNARVAAAAETKRVELDTESARKKLEAQHAAYELITTMRTADALRSTGELANDAFIGASNTIDTLGTAVVAAAAATPYALDKTSQFINDPMMGTRDLTDTGKASRDAAVNLLRESYARSRKLNTNKSEISQVNNAIVDEQNRLAQEENAAIAAQREQEGMPAVLAGALRLGSDVIDGAGNSLDNPTVLFDDVTASSPTLLLGPLGRAAATEAEIAERSAILAARAAANEGAEVAATNTLRNQAIEQIAARNTILATGATEGAGNFGDLTGSLASTSIEELAKRFPEVNQKLAAGISEEDIRNDLSLRVGAQSGAMTALAAGAVAKLVPNINVDPLGTKTAGRTLAQNAIEIAGEPIEEAFQSGSGELANNIARATAGEDVDLLEGVGTAAGRGATAGAATSVAVRGSTGLLQGTVLSALASADASINFIRNRINSANEAGNAEVRAANEERMGKQFEAAVQTEAFDTTSLAPEVAQAVDTAVNQRDDFVPADLGSVDTQTGEKVAPRNRLQAHAAAVYELFSNADNLDEPRRFELQAFVAKNARELDEQINTVLAPALEKASTSEEQGRIQEAINQLRIFTASPEVQELRDGFAQFSEADVKQVFDNLPESVLPDDAPIPAQTAAALAVLNELAIYAPEKITPQMAERGLGARSNMNPTQRARLELARDLAKQTEAYKIDIAAISDPTKPKKASDVRMQIANKGFTEASKKMLSIEQYVAQINAAMSEGRKDEAGQLLARMGRWAAYSRDRADSAQAQALAAFESGSNETVQVTPNGVNDQGKLVSGNGFNLIPSNYNSVAVVQTMGIDAEAIGKSYNLLAKTYPELAQAEVSLPQVTNLVGLIGAAPEKTRELVANRALVSAADRGVNLRAVIRENGQVGFEDAEPMNSRQKAPAVYLPNGKVMTEAQLELLQTGQNIRPLLEGKTTAETKKANQEAQERASKPVEPKTETKTAPVEEEAPEAAQAEPAQAQPTEAEILAQLADLGLESDKVDFNDPTLADQAELEEALSLSFDEYLARVVPEDQEPTSETESAGLQDELADAEITNGAEQIDTMDVITDELGLVGVSIMANGNYLHAVLPDGQIIGLLIANEAGTTLVVDPGFAGKGIGKALMKQLLLRRPFAPAGSMTAAAQQVRRSVLNSLRKSRATSLEERFSDLLQTSAEIKDTDTSAQRLAKKNRIINAHKPQPNSLGLFRRIPNAISEVIKAIQENRFSSLLPDVMKAVQFDKEVIDPIESLFRIHVPAVIEQLNIELNDALNQKVGNQTIRERLLTGSTPDQWNYPNFISLHGVVFNEDGSAQYQPEIAQAMALAGLRWSIENQARPPRYDEDKVQALWDKPLTPEMREAYQNGFYLDDIPRQVGKDIIDILGLQENEAVSRNHSSEVMGALGLQTINAMANLNYLELVPLTIPDSHRSGSLTVESNGKEIKKSDLVLQFARFTENTNWKSKFTPPNTSVLGALVEHYALDKPSIGKPHPVRVRKIKGNSQATSDEQALVEQRHNELGFSLNAPLNDFINKLGADRFRRIRGFDEQDLSQLNKIHANAIKGLNQSILYEDIALNELIQNLEAKAQQEGVSADELKVYWNHRTSKNGRVMAQGVAPQNHKVFREFFGLTKRAITKGDAAAENRMLAAVAQSLGLAKLEHTPDVAIAADKVRDVLGLPAMQAVLNAMTDPQDNFEDLIAAATSSVKNELGKDYKIEVDSAKAIHALLTLAQYQATEAGAQFEYSLTVEIDGVNNGPHNAHMQFLVGEITENDLRQLEQGGVFVGQGEVTLSAQNNTKGDRYRDVANKTLTILAQRFADARKEGPAALPSIFLTAEKLMAATRLADTDVDGEVTGFTRNFGKTVLVPVGYMSGKTSVARKIAKGVADELYVRISKKLTAKTAEELAIATAELAEMESLLNDFLTGEINKEYGKPVIHGKRAFRLPPDNEALRNFSLSTERMITMEKNIEYTVGGAAFDAAVENMGMSRQALEQVVESAKFLSSLAQVQFDNLYEAKRKELIATGELGEQDALTRNQEKEILKQISSILPVAALEQTAEDDPSEGVSVVTRGTGVNFQSTNRKDGPQDREIYTFGRRLRSKIKRDGLADPGVALAPMLVIGTGDVSTIHKLWMWGNKVPTHLQIWDGIDVHPESMADMGEVANQANFEAWNYSALYAIRDMLNRGDTATFEGMTDQDFDKVLSIFYPAFKLEEKKKDKPNFNSREHAREVLQNLRALISEMASKREANWTAMKELGVSTDQMAGGNKAYYAPGTGEAMTQAEVVAYVNRRAAELKENAAPVLRDRQAGANELLPELPSGKKVETYNLTDTLRMLEKPGVLRGKINSFVLEIIKKALPSNLTLVMGEAKAVDAAFAERFPDRESISGFDGYFINGTSPVIYLRTFSPTVLVHELVHAATVTLVETYYSSNQNKLNSVQKAAVAQLEKLAMEFLQTEFEGNDYDRRALANIRDVMNQLRAEGNMAGVVAEFMAYTLTDRRLQKTLMSNTLVERLRTLKNWVVDSVRKLLGLPKNQVMDDWLTEIMGQTMNLVRGYTGGDLEPLLGNGLASQTLNQPMNDPRLDQLNGELARVFSKVEVSDKSFAKLVATDAQRIRFDFNNAGFDMSFEQSQVFEKVQAVFASGMPLDTEVFRAMQRLYEHVMPQLTYQDFMDDPASTNTSEMQLGSTRLAALNQTSEDTFKRSNHLANFVALAMVDDKFRAKLSGMSPPKLSPKSSGSTVDDVLRKGMTSIINTAGSMYTLKTVKNMNQQAMLDALMNRMLQISQQQAQKNEALKRVSILQKAEAQVVKKMEAGADVLSAKAQKLAATPNATRWTNLTSGLLGVLSASLSEGRAAAWKEAQISNFNELNGNKTFRELLGEIIGTSESAYPIALLLNQSKQHVSTLRQRLREETPRQVKDWFSKPLAKKTWQQMTELVGNTDFSAIWESMDQATVLSSLMDEAELVRQIKLLEDQLTSRHRDDYLEASDDLAHWMANKSNKAKKFLYRNAGAIARLHGLANISEADAQEAQPIIDKLVSLKALQKMSGQQRQSLHTLLTTEAEGMQKLINTLSTLKRIELAKGNEINQWKGYVPTSEDPRKQIRLATAAQGKELVRLGWQRMASYAGDSNDVANGLAYYVSTVGNEVTYSQGALQLVVETAGGSLVGTGQTLSKFTGLVIQGNQVAQITRAKQRGLTNTSKNNLIPVFGTDDQGNVVITGYERTLDEHLVKQTTSGDSDLAVSLGIWMGRQAEETTAALFNEKIRDALYAMWQNDLAEGREEEYVALNLSKDPIDQGTWEAIPDHTKSMLLDKFDGKVMVRRDARNNAFGYRNASVRDVFAGYSGLHPEAKKIMRDVALGIFGKNAYKWLAQAEDLLTGAVGTAKDLIVVRSGVVALGNLLSNQFQLLAMGVPLTELPKQFKIAKEIETYLRNEHRIARITAELRAEKDPVKLGKLEREAKMLADNNSRMSIYELIQAGELPTIAEGLSETDEYTLAGDASKWLEERMEKLPKGLTEAGRYALITRDTALYQGLNRMIQFGDLMAKQLMFEQLQREGQTKESALREVQDTFVNYNILPGRTRQALENMGVLWFWNYKLRIQRIFFRTVRKHPLRALIHMGGADLAGADSMFSTLPINTDLSYTVGPGQLARAHELHLWNQVNPL